MLEVNVDGMRGRIQDNGMVSFQADDRVNVLFYRKSVLDPVRSRELGRPHHVSRDYVRIQQPGEKDYADRPVSDDPSVMHRWPQHWSRYQANQEQIPNGTPVAVLFPANPEVAANLATLKVHTVEQLAHVTAEGLMQIGMGATQWQQQARAFLDSAKSGVAHHQLQRELEKRDNQIEVMGNQIGTLKQQIDRLLAERQGVPTAMIPSARPTQAQAAMNAMAPFGITPDDASLDEAVANLTHGAILYDNAAAEAEYTADAGQVAAANDPAPARRGPGRPRKNPE